MERKIQINAKENLSSNHKHPYTILRCNLYTEYEYKLFSRIKTQAISNLNAKMLLMDQQQTPARCTLLTSRSLALSHSLSFSHSTGSISDCLSIRLNDCMNMKNRQNTTKRIKSVKESRKTAHSNKNKNQNLTLKDANFE